MPDRDGIKVLEDVLLVRPEQKVIMLTTSEADNAVKKHLKSIFAKLGVSDRVNAVTEAFRRGFVRP